jgi:mannose-6-phosphate isomerase-like protein (cupin superfamily)
MTIIDIGPDPQSFNLEEATVENANYRTVAWSGRYLQVTLMSIPESGDVGLEMHPETDQFLRLDAGRGRVQMGPSQDNLEFDQEVSDGWCILVPAGTWHNVTNIGDGRGYRRRAGRLVGSACFTERPSRLTPTTRYSLLGARRQRYLNLPSVRVLPQHSPADRHHPQQPNGLSDQQHC